MISARIHSSRADHFAELTGDGTLDVLVIGGGISGASVFKRLCAEGYHTALVDRGDFASGTSQASGMLVWGGLLYLKQLDFPTVVKLCRARDELIARFPEGIRPLDLHYLLASRTKAHSWLVRMALQLYWMLGGCRLKAPHPAGKEMEPAWVYQEGMLQDSDSRFVLEHLLSGQAAGGLPMNHVEVREATYEPQADRWRVVLHDRLRNEEKELKTRVLINAAGVWADEVNRLASISSPWKHVFSKGVYLNFARGEETCARVHPMPGRDDVLTEVPWGPVVMWGPTETSIRDLKGGFAPNQEDVSFLMEQADRCLPGKWTSAQIVSLRCGVRPLIMRSQAAEREMYPLRLSRRYQVSVQTAQKAITLYGGKLTSGGQMASATTRQISGWIRPSRDARIPPPVKAEVRKYASWQVPVVTPEWARDHEGCATLEDYLRRRTLISQWTPRMGLGRQGENRGQLLEIATAFADDALAAEALVRDYEQQVKLVFDPLLPA